MAREAVLVLGERRSRRWLQRDEVGRQLQIRIGRRRGKISRIGK